MILKQKFDKDDCEPLEIIKKLFPYRVEFNHLISFKVKNWCTKNYGESLYSLEETDDENFILSNENAVWDYWSTGMYFKNKEDAMLFKLIWAN